MGCNYLQHVACRKLVSYYSIQTNYLEVSLASSAITIRSSQTRPRVASFKLV